MRKMRWTRRKMREFRKGKERKVGRQRSGDVMQILTLMLHSSTLR